MQIDQYYSDDYAGLVSGRYHFYYGYEKPDPVTGEPCFTVVENGVEVFRLTTTMIEKAMNCDQLYGMNDYLLRGIAIYLLNK